MIRRVLFLAVVALFGATLTANSADVTFVMKNGSRVSGTFSYNHTDHYQLIVNGHERDYPSNDIAMIVFGAGDPAAAEIDRLPTMADPPELERHTIVLRNGDMIRGKIWDFQGDRIIMDMGPGDRRTFNMGDTARLYISAPGSRAVFHSPTPNPATNPTPRGRGFGRGQGLTITIPGAQCWADTGINVVAGQNVSFAAVGEIRMSIDRNDVATPAGSKNGRYSQDAPIPGSLLGALIGRIDNRAPFGIGDQRTALAMPQAGRLWVGVNDGNCQDNSGEFRVTINDRQ